MKEFWIYTIARLALFLVTWVTLAAVSALLFSDPNAMITLLLAFVISGVGSYFVLSAPREALARRVEERAGRASARYEEMRSREDADDDQA